MAYFKANFSYVWRQILAVLFEVLEQFAQVEIIAIEKDAEKRVRGARVRYDLMREEHAVDDARVRFVFEGFGCDAPPCASLVPFEQKYEAIDLTEKS